MSDIDDEVWNMKIEKIISKKEKVIIIYLKAF